MSKHGTSRDRIIVVFLITFLLSGCQSMQRVDRSNTEYVESMKASETELIWIYHLAGIQCEESYYNSTTEAINDLKSHEIEVFDSFKFSVMVAAVCGNASAERFAAQIRRADLDQAQSLEWQFLEDESIIKNHTPTY